MDSALPIVLDREKAAELYRAYKTHQHYEKPIDAEIARTYKLIASGKLVIQAIESIAKAGVGDDGFPRLAIARADQKTTFLTFHNDGSATMAPSTWFRRNRTGISKMAFEWPAHTFPVQTRANRPWRAQAVVPLIPLPLRPKQRAKGGDPLQNYHVLWEAEWSGAVPFDPLLLRRIGKADLWLVVAGWDLTPVERAALATRVGVR